MIKLLKSFVIIGLFLASYSCSKTNDNGTIPKKNEQPASFWNLSGNTVAHDPCLTKEPNSLWWAFMTGTGIGVKYSSNGLYWTQGTQVFPSELSWWRNYAPNMGSNDVWSPDCYYYNHKYWLYYCVSEFGTNNSAIGLVHCSSILTGDWSDDGVVRYTNSSSSSNALDPNICRDASGNLWLVYGSWFDGIHLVKLSKSTMKPTGSTYRIAYKSGGIEQPDILYYGGYYYLFVSLGICCNGVNSTYKIAYGRASSITGPYYDKSGTNMLNGGATIFDAGNSRWKGPGASDIYKHGSNYVIIRHAYDASDNGTPKMLINDLYFSGGWPTY